MFDTRRIASLSSIFAILIGAFLLIEGVMGLSSKVVFGSLTTNTTHAVIHIALGVVGILLGLKGAAKGYCIFLGLLLLAVGILRFVPAASQTIVTTLNVNYTVAYVNIVIGIISLLIGMTADSLRLARR